MTHLLEPVSVALSGSDCPIFERVGKAMVPGTGAETAWRAVLPSERKRGGAIDALMPEDRAVLDALFSHLGESGREEQEAHFDRTISAFDKNLASAEARSREAQRLYTSLGLLTGLMLALIVL